MRRLVVVGGGMVAHRLIDTLVGRGGTGAWEVVLLTEESLAPYDRVALSSYLDGASAADLALCEPGWYAAHGITVRVGAQVRGIDRAARTVTTAGGDTVGYDALVLATGSSPFIPPLPGRDAEGCFVYRTIDDLDAIRAYAEGRGTGVVVGGGLLGLEAAGALRALGLTTHVVEFAPRLMPVQVDSDGGRALARRIADTGIEVHCDARAEAIETVDGRAVRLALGQGGIDTDLVVFSAGVRPRDELARGCGLAVGERGGVVVDDACRTADPAVFAIGECACLEGKVYGLVAPGYAMAEAAADQLLGGDARVSAAARDTSTKLKLVGIDVASFGDAHGVTDGAVALRTDDPLGGVYKKLVVSGDGRRLLGGVLVGDASGYPLLRPLLGRRLPGDPMALLAPAGSGAGLSSADLPDEAPVCSCNAVTAGTVRAAVGDGCGELGALKSTTRAGTGCGSCVPIVEQLRRDELRRLGVAVSDAICEHFAHSRQDLYDLVRVHGYTSFSQLLAAHGTGRGCEICRPAVASILASRGGGYILAGEQAALQDTNDHALANLQRDGTYSVVPRIAGGEITPDGLATIAAVAKRYGLYTKITGGQRIDLFGARLEQLPAIWRDLVDAGFESGHAYGKALRTVKSCVGSTWCRYGVQDSVALAIRLELRYRGLRAPHKIKGAVSGCARECAEAQSKDFGVIATERGWNLYLAGNGGMRPAHGVLFAQDLDTETLVRYIDRVLMYYVMTGDRLERTASWLRRIEGGVDHVRRVVVDDALGLCGEFDTQMARMVAGYQCEWRRTLDDPEALRSFVSFVNAPGVADPDVVFVSERGQPRPATPAERTALLAGAGPAAVRA